ncbi:hypothetical protein GCM10010279_57920 [Streptomyces mutabilis]|nr:hypothetical protein GCM10010279_57920 [Streptomyces mutabilis]
MSRHQLKHLPTAPAGDSRPRVVAIGHAWQRTRHTSADPSAGPSCRHVDQGLTTYTPQYEVTVAWPEAHHPTCRNLCLQSVVAPLGCGGPYHW